MKITDHKVLIEFSPAKVQFFRIDPEDISVTLKSVLRVLMDLSWLSKFDQDFEQKAFESRATKTIEDIKAKFDQCVDDGITKDAGEYMMFTGADFVLPNAVAKEVYEDFQCLYKQYLGRELTAAEKYVFDSAIKIMIWKVHGKTFSKICQERYAYVSNVAQRRFLAKAGQQNRADNLPVRYIAGYSDIPDKELRAYPLFPVGTKGKDVDYDRIVYDTYDFLDKLIGFKLSDLFYAIFHQYYLAYQDNRAERLAKYIKYGTEDSTEIWMLRYGFSFEEIEWLKPCVESIDQTEIRFNGEIESLDDFQRSSIAQYLF